MSCSNCYNGCPQVISDQCVRYTGVDVPVLGIQTGDSLSYVEQALITFLTSTLDGTGIKIDIDPTIICDKVQEYLVTCEDLNAKNLFETLIKVVCDLQVQIDGIDAAIVSIQSTLATLNADYDVDCLSGVTNSSDTHAVLQAVITRLCNLIDDLPVTYVAIADIDTYIQNYLNSIAPSNLYSNKMVPYVAYEYYGPLIDPLDPTSGFDPSGAGYGKWFRVFLCNGDNATPDKRGRVAVGATSGMGGAIPMDPAVNPGGMNPSYTLGSTANGTNGVIITTAQMPSHNHSALTTVTPNPHSHGILTGDSYTGSAESGRSGQGQDSNVRLNRTTTAVDLTVGVNISNSGGDEAHVNYQPGIGAYYIMYIPL
jgi:microcystin-dependent protein